MNITKLLYRISTRTFLILIVLIALIPFLDLRVLRMAGDEKVYISTSIEMARNGTWFMQTLADEPNYFKGPMHYLLVRAGLLVFGNRIVAATWMNALFALLAAFAMYRLGKKRWDEKTGLLLGLATALNVGLFSHAVTSQMEVTVYAFYTFALVALGLATKKTDFRYDLLFWISAGLAGWSKSPLHSVLIGISGIIYWASTGQLIARARSPLAWLAWFAGVGVAVAGYVPMLLWDRENFMATYVMREQFDKVNNMRSWDYVVKPLVHFLLPWTFLVLAGFVKLGQRGIQKLNGKAKAPAGFDSQMVKLGLAISMPSILFWSFWTYKGQNYNLPTMSGLLLFAVACFSGRFPRVVFLLSGILGALALGVGTGVVAHFWPLPAWWDLGWLAVAGVAMLVFTLIYLFSDDIRVLGIGAMAFFIAFGAFITPAGEREMKDIRKFVTAHPDATLHYYNLSPTIWSEWGLLQLTLHQPVYGLHKPEQLADATKPGHAIIVQTTDWLNFVMSYWRNSPQAATAKKPIVTTWARWLTKGKGSDGTPRWKAAWLGRDLRQLERDFYIVWFPR